MQKSGIEPLPHTTYEIQILRKREATKFMEENIKIILHDLGFGKGVLDMT